MCMIGSGGIRNLKREGWEPWHFEQQERGGWLFVPGFVERDEIAWFHLDIDWLRALTATIDARTCGFQVGTWRIEGGLTDFGGNLGFLDEIWERDERMGQLGFLCGRGLWRKRWVLVFIVGQDRSDQSPEFFKICLRCTGTGDSRYGYTLGRTKIFSSLYCFDFRSIPTHSAHPQITSQQFKHHSAQPLHTSGFLS